MKRKKQKDAGTKADRMMEKEMGYKPGSKEDMAMEKKMGMRRKGRKK